MKGNTTALNRAILSLDLKWVTATSVGLDVRTCGSPRHILRAILKSGRHEYHAALKTGFL